MAKLLVTGGAGFIGSHFVEMCVARGHQVTVLDALTYAGHRENLSSVKDKVELVVGDITDAERVRSLLNSTQADAVFNFAAESHVDRSISGASPFITTNVMGTFTLLSESLKHYQAMDEARKGRFRYVQISTDEVFGDLGPDGHFREDTPFNPHSPYSASKASADHLVHAWNHTFKLPTITTHCSNNYGSRQFPEKLIPFMIRCAIEGKPLGVYGNGSNVRDWIHVQDHCMGIWLAYEKGTPGERYCFGGNSERTNLNVVKTICAELDRLAPRADGKAHETGIKFVGDRLGHDRRYAIDDSRAQRELSFTRTIKDFEAGLKETVKWYLDNQEWCQTVLKKERS